MNLNKKDWIFVIISIFIIGVIISYDHYALMKNNQSKVKIISKEYQRKIDSLDYNYGKLKKQRVKDSIMLDSLKTKHLEQKEVERKLLRENEEYKKEIGSILRNVNDWSNAERDSFWTRESEIIDSTISPSKDLLQR